MNYYFVAVGSNKYHGQTPLTYAAQEQLQLGTIVTVPLRNEHALGVIVGFTDKPKFAAKELVVTDPIIPSLPMHSLKLLQWLREYYPAPLGITAQLFLPKHLPKKRRIPKNINAKIDETTPSLPPLTTEQQQLLKLVEKSGLHLLHGETGSGKTRVYIELALQAANAGKSSIILTPEISLTSQLASQFIAIFGEAGVFVLHSGMTDAARRDAWLTIAAAEKPIIVIGARSALFAPVKSIGLIVLDEAHESAYKQENAPHYHATRVAATLASYCGARVILGTATPSVIDYYMASERNRPILRLEQLALGNTERAETTSTVVDLKDRTNTTRNPHLSNALLDAITEQLKIGNQSLLFLNRRGTARIVLCSDCGWQAVCPHCDLPLTYHHDTHTLRCHTCGHTDPALTSCPECHGADITLKSIGTKTIASALEQLFPSARIRRFDADNLTGERIHEQYQSVVDGDVDILVGTQLLAKGFDLPKLGLIGVINADASLHIPDFTAQERTYQLLYQVLGRVGRGHRAGQAIIQTYSPENQTIQNAIQKDWQTFYTHELNERQTYMFPPFCHMLKATCRRASAMSAMKSCAKVREALESSGLRVRIEGPAPSFHEKLHGKYVWQLVLKSTHRSELLKAIELLPKDWSYDIDPVDLL